MTVELGSIDHLSQVISQVVAPSFLLGAVASFISMLFSRLGLVAEEIRVLRRKKADDVASLAGLRRRLHWLHKAILFAVGSGVTTTLLIVGAFGQAILKMQHVWGTAILFIIALTFFCVSLVLLAMDVLYSIKEFDDI